MEVHPPNATISNASETVQFNCTSSGYSKFSMQWVKVSDAYDRVVSSDNCTDNSNDSFRILTVRGAGDGGKYRCVVTKCGEAEGERLSRDVSVYGSVKPA